jgi:fibronectin-binding autotransporter adhesin
MFTFSLMHGRLPTWLLAFVVIICAQTTAYGTPASGHWVGWQGSTVTNQTSSWFNANNWYGFTPATSGQTAVFDPADRGSNDLISVIHFGDYTTTGPGFTSFKAGGNATVAGLHIDDAYTFELDSKTLTVNSADTILGDVGDLAQFTVKNGLLHETDAFFVAGSSSGAFVPSNGPTSNGGFLQLVSNGRLTVDGTMTIWDGGDVLVDATSTLTVGGIRIKEGLLDLTGSLGSFTNLSIEGGYLQLHSKTIAGTSISLKSGALIRAVDAGTSSNTITVSNGTIEGTNTFDIGASDTITLNGNLADGTTAGALNKVGQGTLVLNGTSTYSGGVTLGNGTLRGSSGSLKGNIVLSASAVSTSDLIFDQTTSGAFSGNITGSGTLTKVGAGTLTLTGNNTFGDSSFQGTSTISAGVLQGNASSLRGTIINNASVVFDQASTATYSGNMTGTGSLTKTGAGTLIMTGTSGYGGGTTVSAGILQGDTDSLKGPIFNNASVTFNQTTTGTYIGSMTGAGSLSKTGAGTLIMTGTNNYGGGTTVSSGILQGDTHSLKGTIFNNANVTFNQTFTDTYSGNMTGTGSLTKTGAGTLIMTGTSGYGGGTTVSSGILQGDTDSLKGAIFNNANVTFNQTTTDTYIGNMTGTGSLTKMGTGTLIMTGTNNYGGGTTVSSGILQGDTHSLKGAIFNNASVTFNQTFSDAYSGNMTGSGSLTKTGSGTLSLAGTNTFTGNTKSAGGALLLTNSLALQNSIVDYNNYGGTISFSGITAATFGGLQGNQNLALTNGSAGVALTVNTAGSDRNYSGVLSGAGSLTISGGGTLRLTGLNSFLGGIALNSSTLYGDYSNLGSGPMTINGGTFAITSSAAGISNNITFGGGGATVDTQGHDPTFFGVVSGSGSLRKVGSGDLYLAGNNTYTGETRVISGGLRVQNVNALSGSVLNLNGADTGQVSFLSLPSANFGGLTGSRNLSLQNTVGSPVALTVNTSGSDRSYTGVLSGAGSLTISGGGTLRLGGANTFSGGITLNSSTLYGDYSNLGNGPMTINGGTFAITSSAAGISNNITLGGSGATVDTQGNNPTLFGDLSGTGGLIVQGGAALALSGNNSFTGGLNILTGTTLNVNSTAAALPTTGTVQVGYGAVLNLNVKQDGNLEYGSAGQQMILDSALLRFENDSNPTVSARTDWNGDIQLPRTSTIGNTGSQQRIAQINGSISGPGGLYVDSGIMSFNGNNSFTGGLNILTGTTVNVNSTAAALPTTGTIQVGYGSVLNLYVKQDGNLEYGSLGQQMILDSALLRFGNDSNPTASAKTDWNGDIQLPRTSTIVNTGSQQRIAQINGSISGPGGLLIDGGIVAFNGNNSFTGETRIVSGELRVKNANGLLGSTLNMMAGDAGQVSFQGITSANLGGLIGSRNILLQTTDGAPLALTVGTSGSVRTYSGALSGSGRLIIQGGGILQLTGPNSLSGGITVNASTLVADYATLGSGPLTIDGGVFTIANAAAGITNNITLGNNGAAVDTQGNVPTFFGIVSGNGSLHKVGTGDLYLAGNNSFTGETRVISGALRIQNANALSASVLNLVAGDMGDVFFHPLISSATLGGLSGSRNLLLQTTDGAPLALTVGTAGSDRTYSGALSGSGSLTIQGGGAMRLTGPNSFSGGITLNSSTLFADYSTLSTGPLTINGGWFAITSSASGITNKITLGSNGAAIDTQGRTPTFFGSVTGSGHLDKVSGGTLYLAGNNNFTGDTRVIAGALMLQNVNALASSTLNLAAGDAGDVLFHPLVSSATLGGLSGSRNLLLQTTDGAPLALSVGSNNSSQLYSGILSGSGSLTKIGAGLLSITGANTYTGSTIIGGGTLIAANSSGSATGSGGVTVSAGGKLGGSGSISGTVTVNASGHLAPGNSVESLDVGALVLNTGSILDFELGAPGAPGVNSDLINVTAAGGLVLNGGSFALTDAGGLAVGTYRLIDYAGTLGGAVANLGTLTGPLGFTYALINNVGNTSIDLTVTAAGLAGDYNHNGVVDAADYVAWRKGLGTTYSQADYDVWRAHFGQTSGSGSAVGIGSPAIVPEPVGISTLLPLLLLIALHRRIGRLRPIFRGKSGAVLTISTA